MVRDCNSFVVFSLLMGWVVVLNYGALALAVIELIIVFPFLGFCFFICFFFDRLTTGVASCTHIITKYQCCSFITLVYVYSLLLSYFQLLVRSGGCHLLPYFDVALPFSFPFSHWDDRSL